MKVNLRASNIYMKMSGAAKKQMSSNGIVKLNSLAELGFMPAPVSTSGKLRWSGFKLERFVVSGDVPLVEKFYPSHAIGIALSFLLTCVLAVSSHVISTVRLLRAA